MADTEMVQERDKACELIDEITKTREEVIKLENAVVLTMEEEIYEEVPSIIENIKTDDEREEIEDNLGEEASFYLDSIKNIRIGSNLEQVKNDLREVLPVKDNYNYELLIKRILLEVKREINEINNFLVSYGQDEDYVKELYIEKYNYSTLFQLIREISLEKTVEEVQEKQKNNIVFLEKDDNSFYVFDDLKDIAPDYKTGFLELFESICNGTFKNVRHFNTTNNNIFGVWEAKGFQVRLLFDRVAPHTYVVIAAFIKKSDKDLYYLTYLKNRLQKYKQKESSIKEAVKNPVYMDEQEQFYNILKEKLGNIEIKEGVNLHV